jgi:enoyl-CoA hydratase/carnithine racemase
VEHVGGIRTLTLDSPANRNALSAQLLEELALGLRDVTTDRAVRAVVITGTGTVFCSGADLSERTRGVTTQLPDILTTMTTLRVPVITRVNGHVRAGGIGIVAASDLAVAPARCTMAFSEVRVGVAPAIILVPSLRVSDRRFLTRAVLTGESFSAEEAVRAGLLSAVVADEGGVDAWVASVTESIRLSAPGAVAATKDLLRTLPALGWDDGLSSAQQRSAELFAGAEAAEGMDAFLTKRAPSWGRSET